MKQNDISPQINVTSDEIAITKVQAAANILKASVTADKSLSESDLIKLGFTMDTMIISCFFDKKTCNTSSFKWFHDNEYGNCYTFNSLISETLKTSKPGQAYGLLLELFIGVAGRQDYYTTEKGVKIIVHQRGVKPMAKYQGIQIGTGTSAKISIARTYFSKQPAPYSDCRQDVESLKSSDSIYYKYTLQISKYYQSLCNEICLQYERIIPNCDCSDPSVPIINSTLEICSNEDELECVKEQRDEIDVTGIEDICDQYCPLECDSVLYTTSVSSAVYPTDYYGNILMSQTNINSKFNPKNTFSPDPHQPGSMNSNNKLVRKKGKGLILRFQQLSLNNQ